VSAKKKVYILDGGSLVIDRSQVLWHIDVGTPVRFPVYSVLIEHPDGLFMYDTGYDLDHVNRVLPFELPEQTPDQTIPAQLKACGFDPEQVGFVVNSHFHFDHVGGNKYLTGATTLVNTAELRHAKVPELIRPPRRSAGTCTSPTSATRRRLARSWPRPPTASARSTSWSTTRRSCRSCRGRSSTSPNGAG